MLAAVFSFPVMCGFLLIATVYWFAVRAIAEPDIWWHIRNAQYLLQHHAFPRFDTYSLGAAGSPWMDFEWLSEIPYLLAFNAMGLRGILVVYFALLVLIFCGVYYLSCRAGAECKDAALVTILAVFFAIVSIGPRTLLFGWLCLVALLLVLDRFERSGKGIWLLPPLFAVWINLHGSWVFGMVVLVIFVAAGLVKGKWGSVVARRWTTGELRKLLMVLAVSIAALLVNPFGYKLVRYPFDVLFRQSINIKYMQEWQSVDFGKGSGKLVMFFIFAWLGAALFSRRTWKAFEIMLMAFALWTALSHVRFVFFVGLVMVPVFAPRLHLLPPYDREEDKPWLNGLIIAGVVFWLIFSFPSNAKLQQQVDEQFPAAALNFMQREHRSGKIFNTDAWGGYMEWNAPELKPFTDGRQDIFVYNGTFKDYVATVLIQSPFEVLDKYRFDYVLTEPNQPLSYLLEQSPKWHPLYSDKTAALFERVKPQSVGH